MVMAVTLLIIAGLIVAIWVIIEIKRLKHKLFAIFLIAFILFGYISFTFVLRGQDIDFKTVPGLFQASKLYMAWIGSIFSNLKSITTYAVDQEWKVDEEKINNIQKTNSSGFGFLK